jgi:fructosamine-3-kinase
MSLAERLEEAEKVETHALERVREANTSYTAAALVTQRLRMLLLVEEYPGITEFSFDANYEYDDEGSYFYCANVWAHYGDRRLDWDLDLTTEEGEKEQQIMETVDDLIAHSLDDQMTELLFGDKWSGSLTVEQLRAQDESS